MRKIIQIVGFKSKFSEKIMALCNDGTVWENENFGDKEWKQLPEIPQLNVQKKGSADEV